jgi:hypothetical protein
MVVAGDESEDQVSFGDVSRDPHQEHVVAPIPQLVHESPAHEKVVSNAGVSPCRSVVFSRWGAP